LADGNRVPWKDTKTGILHNHDSSRNGERATFRDGVALSRANISADQRRQFINQSLLPGGGGIQFMLGAFGGNVTRLSDYLIYMRDGTIGMVSMVAPQSLLYRRAATNA
jgi:hypothetical protein